MSMLRGWGLWALRVVVALAGAAPLASWAQAATGDPSVFVNNRSDRGIAALRVSLSSETSWGTDRLNGTVLRAGQRHALVLPRGTCQYDMRAEYEGGGVEEKLRQDLCAVSEITFDGRGRTSGSAPATPPPAARATTGNPSFWLVNGAQRSLQAFYAWRVDSRERGADRLGTGVLAAGERFAVRLPEGPCLHHLRAEYGDNIVEERRSVDLCAATEVRFDGRGVATAPQQPAQPGAPATGDPSIVLVNRSRQIINNAYASRSTDSEWGSDRLGEGVLAAGQRVNLPLPRGECRWDLRVVYDNNRAEEKRDQNLCAVNEVAFDGSGAVAIERDQAQGPQPGQTPRAPQAPRAERRGGFGTGFFISAAGHMLTNHHVIDGCRDIRVHLETGPVPAVLLRQNERNDLALLRVAAAQGTAFARFRAQPSIRPGDGVVVAGFPLPDVLQNGLNITTGTVSAMAGMGGDIALMQITAPVQPGNSGGPLLDLSGNVVDVIVSKLNAQHIAERTGDIPQNINFAVQGAVARLFLESGGTRYVEAASATDLRAADVGERSREFTRQIECR